MNHTKEELEAAEEYAKIETERYKETRPSKYEDDGSKKYFAQCKSDFLTGITFQKERQSDIVKELKVDKCLGEMLKSDQQLYEKILDTTGFAYWFNRLCKLAGMPDDQKERSYSKEDLRKYSAEFAFAHSEEHDKKYIEIFKTYFDEWFCETYPDKKIEPSGLKILVTSPTQRPSTDQDEDYLSGIPIDTDMEDELWNVVANHIRNVAASVGGKTVYQTMRDLKSKFTIQKR